LASFAASFVFSVVSFDCAVVAELFRCAHYGVFLIVVAQVFKEESQVGSARAYALACGGK
jgi:hypothetical protein